jgi:hypothetical protein
MQDKLNGAKRVNRYGWTLTMDGSSFWLDPPPEAVEWFKRYRDEVLHCDDGGVELFVSSKAEADKIIAQWVDHCVIEHMCAERERLKALAVLDALAESR